VTPTLTVKARHRAARARTPTLADNAPNPAPSIPEENLGTLAALRPEPVRLQAGDGLDLLTETMIERRHQRGEVVNDQAVAVGAADWDPPIGWAPMASRSPSFLT
jgi:hypothetical protein